MPNRTQNQIRKMGKRYNTFAPHLFIRNENTNEFLYLLNKQPTSQLLSGKSKFENPYANIGSGSEKVFLNSSHYLIWLIDPYEVKRPAEGAQLLTALGRNRY